MKATAASRNFDDLADSAQVNLNEATQWTHLSASTLRRLIKRRKIRANLLTPRALRISAGEVRRFLGEGTGGNYG